MGPLIKIKSFNGIGDLLFVTPTLRRIKEAYPDCKIIVNTNHPWFLQGNPYVDEINTGKDGIFLGYADPIHAKNPTTHHIISDWEIVCKNAGIKTEEPILSPEIHCMPASRFLPRHNKIGVQVIHKGHWHKKKVWPWFEELSKMEGFEPIPKYFGGDKELAMNIAGYPAVVCAEGGISHIAKAVGTPAVVIFGGFANPKWNGCQTQLNLCALWECSYCYNPGPCIAKEERACMRVIEIDIVAELAKNMAITNDKKLNIGSGLDIKENWINFDAQKYQKKGLETDVIGKIEDLDHYFEPFSITEAMSSHVLEHFREEEGIKFTEKVLSILKPGGRYVLEAPDVIRAYKILVEKMKDPDRYCAMLMGTIGENRFGSLWRHRSAWYREKAKRMMERVGFKVVHTGKGYTHGMGEHDFRVEGRKEIIIPTIHFTRSGIKQDDMRRALAAIKGITQ